MQRTDVVELHFITAKANIPSILQLGILSHERSLRVQHVSIASEEVQARRVSRSIPGGLRLHQYVNLYFNGRNSMLYRRIKDYDVAKRIPPEELVVLRVADGVLDRPGVVITDINAAADIEPRWHTVVEGLPKLDKEEIEAERWTSREHMQRMMAEVLVPHRVPPTDILGTYVVSDQAAANLSLAAPTLACDVQPYMFFKGPRS